MGRPLGPEPDPKTYREHLALQIRQRAVRKFPVTADFQQALQAAGADVSLKSIYHWFAGRRYPDVEHLQIIARVLGCKLDTLIPPCPARLRETIGKGQQRKS